MNLFVPKRLVELSLINFAAKDSEGFIQLCENSYKTRIASAVDDILARDVKVVMLTGPSSSGKTTTAEKICEQLTVKGHPSCVIPLDNFYRNIDEYPKLSNGSNDYENVMALDVLHIRQCISELVMQDETVIPEFDFVTERRKETTTSVKLGGGTVIIEGIHALNPILTDNVAQQSIYKVYAGMREEYCVDGQRILPTIDIRLVRRMLRDFAQRGHPLHKTMAMWPGVCEGEDKYIKVFKQEINYLLDTSFSYEICCLAPLVQKLFADMDKNDGVYPVMQTLAQRFSLVSPIDTSLIPQNSMLKEFI